MSRSVKVSNRFYYVVRSGFFSHIHIYEAKMTVLQSAGVQTQIVSFVLESEYQKQKMRYDTMTDRVEIVMIPHSRLEALWRVLYFVKKLLFHNVTIQILRTKPPCITFLRIFARIVSRSFVFLYEMEGDASAEAAYLKQHPYKNGFYQRTLLSYQNEIVSQLHWASVADGLVLMSNEHRQLWETRIGHPVTAVSMPAIFNPKFVFFDPAIRKSVRLRMGLNGKIVIIYTGSILNSWQKFGTTCRILARMKQCGLNVMLLALVRKEDHPIAIEFIKQYNVADFVNLTYVPFEEVSGYLSAADIGIFLRDEHLMNQIVTSAKLGEYLASGLPILTTGVGALYHDYIRQHKAGLFINNLQTWDIAKNAEFLKLVTSGRNEAWRTNLCHDTFNTFCGSGGPVTEYVKFVKDFLCATVI